MVVVYIDPTIFLPRNFQGILQAVSGDNPPVLTVNTEGKNYSVMLTSSTQILNNARNSVSLKRYLVGDTVRLYGAIRQAEDPIIDAQIVRDIDL